MKNIMISLLSAGAGVLALSNAVAQDAAVVSAPMTLAEATAGPSQVTVWKTGDADTTVYLFGTVHILDPNIEWQNAAFASAWNDADVVYLEADATSPEAQQQIVALIPALGFNAPGTTLSSYYNDDQIAEINAVLQPFGVSMANFDPFRPWLAGLQLGNMALMSIGGQAEAGVEIILTGMAAEAGKDIRYFETLEEQLNFFANGDDEIAAAMFYDGIDELADAEPYFSQLVGHWYNGEPDELAAFMQESFEGFPDFRTVILDQRNERWATTLDQLISEEEGVYFIAVGAAHLAGENSVQDYLTTHGHETVVYSPAANDN